MSDAPQSLSAALADRYRIERELGAGGMATVYLAHDLKHNRRVAVKVLRPDLASLLGAERFLREIEVTANLQHPNILPLYDSGEAGSYLYFVTPYIEGESLRAKIDREGSLSEGEALKIADSVAAALQFAHERGVVHRDIKPENILLQAGQALVADFGIALAVADADAKRLTETGYYLGTPGYMSPEQAAGDKDIDARSDIYSLGCLLYEMLAGEPPFGGSSAQAVLTKIIIESPRPLGSLRPSLSESVESAVHTALAKNPEDRFQSAVEFVRALEAGRPGAGAGGAPSRLKRTAAAIGVALAVIVVFLGYRLYRQSADQRWLRETAIPEIETLMNETRYAEAYELVATAQKSFPDDPRVRTYFEEMTVPVDVTSHPSGAHVWYRGYASDDTVWHDAGLTPIDQKRFPVAHLRVRLELDGYPPVELGFLSNHRRLDVHFVAEAEDEGMVWVPPGVYEYSEAPVPIDSFLIDRHEVTNAQYQAFIDAGGYRASEYWGVPFLKDGRALSWEAATAELVDATGRPGPAGWELSRYPEGRDDFPVRGVSWYEAAAYCAFAGKSLPTYYHWNHAAGQGIQVFDDVIALSNFNGDGPVEVGSLGAVSHYGVHDMAGNVREWVWNVSQGLRLILGGAWNDPEYLFTDVNASDPWSRLAKNGFRCARYFSPSSTEQLAAIDQPYVDFNSVEPVDDATFEIYRSLYDYDPVDLDVRVLAADTAEYWIRQKVDFTAAYADERVIAYVFLPLEVEPPYQTVVYFPGSPAFVLRSSVNLAETARISFIPRSGRALVYPVYKGSYERYIENPRPGPAAARQRMIWMTQDLQRSVDFVVAREDLRDDAVGFIGLSLGAEIAVPFAIEKRFKALVLVGGAFDAKWRGHYPPEAAPWNFASRITTPTMLINGRRDFMHPYQTGQVPYFNAFDVPESDKEFVVLDAGHVPDWNDVIRHTLAWFDRYLGPVR